MPCIGGTIGVLVVGITSEMDASCGVYIIVNIVGYYHDIILLGWVLMGAPYFIGADSYVV